MKYELVAIRDAALNAYQEAFSTRALPQAIRAFNDAVQTRGNPMNAHPQDYTLWHVGRFDDETGYIEAFAPTQIASAIAAVPERLNHGITITGNLAGNLGR